MKFKPEICSAGFKRYNQSFGFIYSWCKENILEVSQDFDIVNTLTYFIFILISRYRLTHTIGNNPDSSYVPRVFASFQFCISCSFSSITCRDSSYILGETPRQLCDLQIYLLLVYRSLQDHSLSKFHFVQV